VDPFRVALAFVVVAVLLAGCGGGGAVDGAKVEAGLRHYLSTLDPETSTFPTGSGPPQVTENSCKKMRKPRIKLPPKMKKLPAPIPPFLQGASDWSCAVTFLNYSLPVHVLVKANGEVLFADPAPPEPSPPPVLPPATTYEGGPEQPKP
jgi:hypothetical protein